jgi:hypothetical protein
MKMSSSIENISKALLNAQKNIGVAVKGEKNPFFKSRYADLATIMEVVKEPLNTAGISVLQAVGSDGSGTDIVETVLLHESGEFLSTEMRVTSIKQNDPQAQGSAISYARRYSLQGLLFVPSVDDDAEGAMSRKDTTVVSKKVELVTQATVAASISEDDAPQAKSQSKWSVNKKTLPNSSST